MGNSYSTSKNLNLIPIFDKDIAQKLLNEAEQKDFYLEECFDDKVNSKARAKMTYAANSIPFKEQSYIRTFLESVNSVIPVRLLNDLKDVKLVQLMPTADGGMPHTRPNSIICYPDISQLYSKTTLIHELWHVHQRLYPDFWFRTFKALGWSVWTDKLPEQLENARRYNPDTLDIPLWIYENKWVPIPIFKDITRPNVSDVEIWFYNTESRYHVKRVPDEIAEYFPNLPPSAYEHPRELTAYMLSEPDKYKNTLGFKHLIESIGQISILNENVS